jgi:hypothetical protein
MATYTPSGCGHPPPKTDVARNRSKMGLSAIEKCVGLLVLAGVLQYAGKVDRCKGVTFIESREVLREQLRERFCVPGAGRRVIALAKVVASYQKHERRLAR